MLVSMLLFWQKPKDFFKAPTYTTGGSNSSHTRQGGTKLMPATMILMLLGTIFYKNKRNKVGRSAEPDFFIDFCKKNTFLTRCCPTPKAY